MNDFQNKQTGNAELKDVYRTKGSDLSEALRRRRKKKRIITSQVNDEPKGLLPY